MLPLWEDVLPNVPDESARRRGRDGRRRTLTRDARSPAGARPAGCGTTDAVVIGLGSMIGAGRLRRVRARRPRRPAAGCCSGSRSPRGVAYLQRDRVGAARGAVPDVGRHVRLRPRAARASGGASSPAGGSSSARPRRARRWRSTFAAYAVPARLACSARSRVARRARADGRQPARRSRAPPRSRGCSSRCVLAGARRRGRRRSLASGARERRAPRRPPLGTGGRTASSSRPGCSSSRSPATRASPRSARRCASPARTIPRAIPIALGIALVRLRRSSRVARCSRPGRPRLAAPPRRSRPPSTRSGAAWAAPVVRVGAAVASLGSLLALIAGHRAHEPRDGPRTATCRAALAAVAPAPPRARTTPSSRSRRRWSRARADDRPARRDRLLVVRRAPLLRRRERGGVHAGPRRTAAGRAR